MANKASVADQQRQVQDNIHCQIRNICDAMDDILLPDGLSKPTVQESTPQMQNAQRPSGLSFAIGKTVASANQSVTPETQPLTSLEVSQNLKDRIGYTLEVKPSEIPHKEAGQGLFLTGETDVGAVVAFYPGVIYSPAYYQNIPGYPRVDACNSYLITRYDGFVINAQPWGTGGESREVWDGCYKQVHRLPSEDNKRSSDRLWKMLAKPSQGSHPVISREVLERRNPLAFGHFANHPAKETSPNVMVCPYDFPVMERQMRVYIPNIMFGSEESAAMRRFGSFWFKSWKSSDQNAGAPVMKTLVLVATRALCDEEVLLNYRLSNSKRRPSWYSPVDEEEDRRRWS
ncbi:SET domain-containing protein [Dioscorea alata]|nr:SET domain-containing protein [Dioscorea alata]